METLRRCAALFRHEAQESETLARSLEHVAQRIEDRVCTRTHPMSLADQITFKIDVLLNGKPATVFEVPRNTSREEILEIARSKSEVRAFLAGRHLRREIVVPGRIVNFIA